MRISEMATMNTTEAMQIQNITGTTTQKSDSVTGEQGDEVKISPFAELLNKLKELKEKDPEAFKETVAELAKDVREKASTATGMEEKMLNNLADDLGTVAETGDLSALQPKPPEENGDFAVSNGVYGPKDGRTPPEPPDMEGASSMQTLMASLMSTIDKALAS